MRQVPTLIPYHPARWGPGDVMWEHSDGSLVPWESPGYGVFPRRLRGPTLGQPLRLRDDRREGAWYWGVNSFGLAFPLPARLANIDIVNLDEATALAFSASPQSSTYPGTGTHLTGAADRDLLLVLPTSGPRTAAIHVWGYRGVYMLGGRLKPLPTGTVTTTAAVNATTVWHGLAAAMVRIIPHPDAVDPFAFIAGVKVENDPSLHGSSGGIAFGNIFSFGSFVPSNTAPGLANLPTVYVQNGLIQWVPGWVNTLNVSNNQASRSSMIGFGEGGIRRAFFANLDCAVSHWGRLTGSSNARPTANASPIGTGKITMRNVQFRPLRDQALYPYSSVTPLYVASTAADIDGGLYHETSLDNVWSTAHPAGRASDTNLVSPTSGSAPPLDRGDYLEFTAFVGPGREAPPLSGRLDIGESPVLLAPDYLMGLNRRVSSLAQLDALIAGA